MSGRAPSVHASAAIIAALFAGAGCVDDVGLGGKRCDPEHACVAGFECFAGVCVVPDSADAGPGEGEGGEGEGDAGEGEGDAGEGEGDAGGEGEGDVAGEGEGEGEGDVGPLAITSFEVASTATTVDAWSRVTIAWTSTGAVSCTLTGPGVDVTGGADDTGDVTLAATSALTLACSDGVNSVNSELVVDVALPQAIGAWTEPSRAFRVDVSVEGDGPRSVLIPIDLDAALARARAAGAESGGAVTSPADVNSVVVYEGSTQELPAYAERAAGVVWIVARLGAQAGPHALQVYFGDGAVAPPPAWVNVAYSASDYTGLAAPLDFEKDAQDEDAPLVFHGANVLDGTGHWFERGLGVVVGAGKAFAASAEGPSQPAPPAVWTSPSGARLRFHQGGLTVVEHGATGPATVTVREIVALDDGVAAVAGVAFVKATSAAVADLRFLFDVDIGDFNDNVASRDAATGCLRICSSAGCLANVVAGATGFDSDATSNILGPYYGAGARNALTNAGPTDMAVLLTTTTSVAAGGENAVQWASVAGPNVARLDADAKALAAPVVGVDVRTWVLP